MTLRRKKGRSDTGFSLSFLDCICCGFGAIILLFVISMGADNQVIRDMRNRLQLAVQQRLAMYEELRTEEDELTREVAARTRERRDLEEEQRRLESAIAELINQIQRMEAGREALLADLELTQEEIAMLQRRIEIPQPDTNLPVGLPVESTHIAFVIDTSGSMRDFNTGRMIRATFVKIEEILNTYPIVNGVQILDADGRFVLRGSTGRWLPDGADTRRNILESLWRYEVFSRSNPVPGIFRAIRELHDASDPDMKMGVYVLGDEFTGTADPVIAQLERINPRDGNGNRLVTINAVGFPTVLRYRMSMDHTGLKYANLMREITHRHGGAFIAITE